MVLLPTALLLGAATVQPQAARACAAAGQEQRYILGRRGDDLVVLHLSLDRVGLGTPDEPIRWRGKARVELVGPDGDARVHERLAAVRGVPEDNYGDAMRPVFRRARELAHELQGFEPAGQPRYRSCEVGKTCGDIRVEVEGDALEVRDTSGEAVRTIRPEDALGDFCATSLGQTDPSPKDLTNALVYFRIVHVFEYRVGDEVYRVVNLGAGGQRHASPELSAWPPDGCGRLQDCPPHVKTLHHGAHVDVILR